ncbi:MAG: HAD-IIIA family hydrolase [Candidatus Cloacimonadia bacterium]|jgi:3-deoxy-D-manno-octulosonate 8-phosphate phosphatase (KDO 8-P phosphatase)
MIDYNKIKLLILDCDGVLSDGMVIYSEDNIESKAFSTKDGLGLILLRFTDIKVAVITGRSSKALVRRTDDLKLNFLYQGVKNKVATAQNIIDSMGIGWENVAFMGDDLNDYPLLKKVGFTATTESAPERIKQLASFVSTLPGGNGAVREYVEYILQKQNRFEQIVDKYLEDLLLKSKVLPKSINQ